MGAGAEQQGMRQGAWPWAPAYLLQQLDLVLQELVDMLRLLLSLLELAPELSLIVAAQVLRIGTETAEHAPVRELSS